MIKEYSKFKEDQMPWLLKLFNEIKKEAIFPNSFWEANTALISKPEKD